MRVQRIRLDFAPRRARPTLAAVAAFAAGALVLVAAGLLVGRVWLQRAALHDEMARVEAAAVRPATRPTGKAPTAEARAKATATRQIALAMERPWDDLLAAMERRPSEDVALLAVEPSASKRSVRITAEARNPQSMLQHLAMLQSDSRLASVWLVSHQRQQQAPGNPWRYQIQGVW